MEDQKLAFIKTGMFSLLKNIPADTKGNWGKMNAQQMVEHTADFFDVSANKGKQQLFTPEEHLPKYMEFLLSDKQFRENTKAPLDVVPEEPQPLRTASMEAALKMLQQSVDDFCGYFENNPSQKTIHPVFGPLNFNEWVLLHYKHITHHLRQFGLMPQ